MRIVDQFLLYPF